ncbi:acyl carrier protein [Actinomadura yumaensis]|uniref:acyl carrier protein n=1 Tax=Actinomadura yumaensis TaxID=111807 RepID=UPI00362385AE
MAAPSGLVRPGRGPRAGAVHPHRHTARGGGLGDRRRHLRRRHRPRATPAPAVRPAAQPAAEVAAQPSGNALDALVAELGEALGLPADQIPRRRPLRAVGCDSLTATDVRERVLRAWGVAIPAATLLGATAEEIAEQIAERLAE